MDTTKRRYDLDWLRVIAILAVYFHHLGMPFNGDDFHIMNSESSKLLDDIMVFFEQVRLPLLFLISGTGTVFAFSKRTWKQFFKERTGRLLIPLFFGVLFIVPPQTYFQYINEFPSYWEIYKNGRFEINHLWFIKNLYVISVLLIPMILFIKSDKSRRVVAWIEKITNFKIGLLLGVIPLMAITVFLKKYYPTDSSSLSNLSTVFLYTYFFITGILFASSQLFWENLIKYRRFHLVVFVVSTLVFYAYYYLPNEIIAPYVSIPVRWAIWFALGCLVGWCFVLTLLGYAQLYLNEPSRLLQKMNEAIYPFYILHQTVLVVLGYYIIQLDLNIAAKIGLLFISSFPVIVLIYRFLIYPFHIPRILFGMKKQAVRKPILKLSYE